MLHKVIDNIDTIISASVLSAEGRNQGDKSKWIIVFIWQNTDFIFVRKTQDTDVSKWRTLLMSILCFEKNKIWNSDISISITLFTPNHLTSILVFIVFIIAIKHCDKNCKDEDTSINNHWYNRKFKLKEKERNCTK